MPLVEAAEQPLMFEHLFIWPLELNSDEGGEFLEYFDDQIKNKTLQELSCSIVRVFEEEVVALVSCSAPHSGPINTCSYILLYIGGRSVASTAGMGACWR